jgi:hypothetical protein
MGLLVLRRLDSAVLTPHKNFRRPDRAAQVRTPEAVIGTVNWLLSQHPADRASVYNLLAGVTSLPCAALFDQGCDRPSGVAVVKRTWASVSERNTCGGCPMPARRHGPRRMTVLLRFAEVRFGRVGDDHPTFVDPESFVQPGQRFGRPPVPPAHHSHEGRYQHQPC